MNILIIGASSGIGRSLAGLYAEEDHYVIVTGRREELLNEVVSAYPDRMEGCFMDVTKGEETENELNKIAQARGGLDLIVLSAGTGELNKELDYLPERETNEVNVMAFTLISGWAYKFFEKQGRGHFACITSVAGLRGGCVALAYNASKAFQINYLEGLRQKNRRSRSGICITDICPGSVNTEMMKGEGHFWIATENEAARQIKRALDKGKRKVYVTRRWWIIAQLLKRIPSWLYERM